MMYVFLYHDTKSAEQEFKKALKRKVLPINRARVVPFVILLNNDDEFHFMGFHTYDKWKIGKTYVLYETLYHSGTPLEEKGARIAHVKECPLKNRGYPMTGFYKGGKPVVYCSGRTAEGTDEPLLACRTCDDWAGGKQVHVDFWEHIGPKVIKEMYGRKEK